MSREKEEPINIEVKGSLMLNHQFIALTNGDGCTKQTNIEKTGYLVTFNTSSVCGVRNLRFCSTNKFLVCSKSLRNAEIY